VIGDRWGVTDEEVARPFPCDEWGMHPKVVAWRSVIVHASPSELWPWVGQVRLAPYSYDWIDNLARRSPRTLRNLPEPVVGEAFTRAAGVQLGRILSVEPPRQLTGRITGAAISYILEERASHSTRLVMKAVSDLPRVLAPVLAVGDLVMARRQLLNWKQLAEGRTATRT
jgi:hypothetical protein